MHFFRLGKICMCQIQMTEIQVSIGKFCWCGFGVSHEPWTNRHEPNIKYRGSRLYAHFYNWKKNVGYADQKLIFSNENVLKTVAFGEDEQNISHDRVVDCLKKVGLLDFFMSNTDKLNMLIGENGLKLSGGQLQKLNIARALYLKPKVLILDEVTNNLDIKSQEELLKLLNLLKNQSLIIMATHSDNVLKKCDLIINL